MSSRIMFSRVFFVIIGLLLSVNVSNDEVFVPVTVTNRTGNYLHLRINSKSFTYIETENSVVTEVKADAVTIHARYSPGQGKFGVFTKDYSTTNLEKTGGASSCNTDTNTCTTEPTTEVVTPLGVYVTITADSLR